MTEQPTGMDRRRPKPRLDAAESEPPRPERAEALLGQPDAWLLQRYLGHVVRRARLGPVGTLLLLHADSSGQTDDAPSDAAANQARPEMAQRLAGALRIADFVVALDDGDFGVVLEATALAEGTLVAERVLRTIRHVAADVAIGITPIDGSLDAAAVVDLARAALSRAQQADGGECIVVSDADDTGR